MELYPEEMGPGASALIVFASILCKDLNFSDDTLVTVIHLIIKNILPKILKIFCYIFLIIHKNIVN